MILLIDNYDSFVHNLARYLCRLGQETRVVRNDVITTDQIRALQPELIVLSPGPCTPREAGCSLSVVRELGERFPILGVCLGHQAIGAAFGAAVVRARTPIHGRSSPVQHDARLEFFGLPNPLRVGRYHSLVVDESTLPAELDVSARTADGEVMAMRHRHWPLVGFQFHPESILTECGFELLANVLGRFGLTCGDWARGGGELIEPAAAPWPAPTTPVTF